MALLLAFLPTLLVTGVLVVIEHRRGARGHDWRRNLEAWGAQLVAAMLLLPLVPRFAGHALIDGARLPFWAGFAVLFVARDLAEYVFHRAQHRVPFLWAMHSLHHSDPAMSALTTQRHFWGDQIVKQASVWGACLILITPTPAMWSAYGLASLWNFLTHSDLRLDFGRLSWLLNCPAYHRRHHSALPEHYDSNFAAMLPIFDVLCRSYHRPDGYPPTGLARQPRHLGEVLVWPLVWNEPASSAEPAPAA